MIKSNISNKILVLILINLILWIPLAYFDSVPFAEFYVYGKIFTTCYILLAYFFLFFIASLRLKLLLIVIVPLSYLGELIFSTWLGMYEYRTISVPLYVPFGHGVVFASSWILSCNFKIRNFFNCNKKAFILMYILLFCFVILYFRDTLSLLFGILFFLALKRKKYNSFYLLMGFVVLYLELLGTFYGCWKWKSDLGYLQTVNPPLGAIFIYVGGDMLLNKIVRKSLPLRRKNVK